MLDVHEDAYVCRVEKLSAGAPIPDGQEYGLGTQDTPSFPGMDEAARWLVEGHAARRALIFGRETEARPPARRGTASRAPRRRVGFLHLQRPRNRNQLPHAERTEGGLYDIDVHHCDEVGGQPRPARLIREPSQFGQVPVPRHGQIASSAPEPAVA